jgi:hypothetical protein
MGEINYFIIPMARIVNNTRLLNPKFTPKAVEEPQIVFRKSAVERFNENLR